MAWLTGWGARAKLTVDGTVPGLSGSVTMPCCVSIPASLKSLCQANGEDLRITSSDGETLLDYGIEDWSAAEPVVHFRHTFNTGDTEVYAYGGNALASDDQDKVGVAQDCVGYWPLGDAGPTYAYDWTGTNTGSQSGGVTFGQMGRQADACGFDGDNDFLDLGTIGIGNPLMLNGSDLTVSVFIKPVLTGDSYQRIVDKSDGGAGQNGYAIITNGSLSGFETTAYANGNAVVRTSTLPTVNVWNHLAWTHTNNAATDLLWFEGSSIGGSQSAQIIPNAETNMRIGSWNHSTGREYKGDLDGLIIFPRVCSADEIKFLAKAYPASAMLEWGALVEPSGIISRIMHHRKLMAGAG